jgi:diacylglycerol kinase family enzyme
VVEDLDFERIIGARNPASTRARQSHRVVAHLQEVFGDRFHLVETSENERATVESLAELLREGDMVVPIGGDSTASQAAGAISLRQDLLKVPLLPLPFGHANQLAFMLNSWMQYRRPVRLFRHGKTIPIHPMYLHRSDRNGESARLALFTIGLGFTGQAAAMFDSPRFRTHPLSSVPVLRKVPEAAIVLRALQGARPFRKNGGQRFEVLVANGPRVAKHGRFRVALPQRSFALFELESTRPTRLIPVFIRFIAQSVQAAEILSDTALAFSVEAIDGEEIYGQADGQPFTVRTGEIVIAPSPRPLYAVTTRPSLYGNGAAA